MAMAGNQVVEQKPEEGSGGYRGLEGAQASAIRQSPRRALGLLACSDRRVTLPLCLPMV